MEKKPEPIDIPLPYLPPVIHVEKVKAYVISSSIIDTNGTIIESKIHAHKSYTEVEIEKLDTVVIEAVKKAEYSPLKYHGKPVRVRVLIPYVLRNGKWEVYPYE
jgi:hypothetical protein